MNDSGGHADRAGRGEDDVVQTNCDWSDITPSRALVDAIAALEGVDPVALATDHGTALYEYVDPEALDTLFSDGPAAGTEITLSIDGYTAQITGSGLVVEPSNAEPDGSK